MLFPNSDIFTLQDADYPHRAVVSRIEAADAILKQLELLQYDNFKKSIDEKKYSNTCNTVWKVLFDYGRKFRKLLDEVANRLGKEDKYHSSHQS